MAESDVMNRILVIDDEPSIAEMISDVLTRFGYSVKIAYNGRQGLQLLKNATFDLVVTDMCMPDHDGASIVCHIRSSSRPLTPVIGISGTPWLLHGTGCDAALAKPFALQTLIDTVNHLKTTNPSISPEPSAFPLSLKAQPLA